MYGLNDKKNFCESIYEMADEPNLAALFTTGNGYMGVRGSFEEFGSLRVQGAFVRGFIDEFIEVCEPFADNEYMKKYYLDEEKLKTFEKQETCVNMHDFLTIKIIVGEKTFFPWDGKILEWNRELDSSSAVYKRRVLWDDGCGNVTEFEFERFASFADQNLYCQRVIVKPVNHSLPVTVISGIDTSVKTGGQFITETDSLSITGADICHKFHAVNKYKFSAAYAIKNVFPHGRLLGEYTDNGTYGVSFLCDEMDEYVIEKFTFIVTGRDTDEDVLDYAKRNLTSLKLNYEYQKSVHIMAYMNYFRTMDVEIAGNDEADGYLRFANYHTAISAAIHDDVHGISAKGLTGERYNQFVWWDCEIHQLPFFILTAPRTAKNALAYRYRMLGQAKENARKNGYDGAMFAFCSSVEGDERVWQYARHPFMQIHINSDIPYGVINYYHYAQDEDFMTQYGMEIIYECLKFWLSRITYQNGRYEILNVTGTDEHHPYVNNDAYTNYCVRYIFSEFLKLNKGFNYVTDISVLTKMQDVVDKLYLPVCDNGLIPQFDGYFSLSKNLEEEGNGTLKQFQMKKSGLYHKSQVIKQPDVILLYTMVHVGMDKAHYAENWDYYENMCEVSSSLTFPVHSIASIQNNRIFSFHKYFMNMLKVDVDNIFGVAWQGVHSGCLAGGYLAVMFGVFGLSVDGDTVCLDPRRTLFDSVKARFIFRGITLTLTMTGNTVTVEKSEGKQVKLRFCGEKTISLENSVVFSIKDN